MKQIILLILFSFITLFKKSQSIDDSYFTRYRGYSIAQVPIDNDNDFKQLQNMARDNTKIQVLGENKHYKWAKVLVAPEAKSKFEAYLRSNKKTFSIIVDDLETAIRNEYKTNRAQIKEPFSFNKYQPLENIHDWIDDIATKYPAWINVFNVTYSYEGRPLKMFKISIGNKAKPAIWIDGGIHAREWISPATVVYIADKLLSLYNQDENVKTILDTFDFYFLPVFNVDGYVYTFETDRLWRKTRSLNNNSDCVGTDPNRNWDYDWCKAGASNDTCSIAYCGSKAFSEVEVRGVAEFLEENQNSIVSYMNFHSFSQLWMTPWGYTKDTPKDYDEMMKGAEAAVNAIKNVYGTHYDYGSIANIIYEASGSSADWTYGHLNILYSYGVELRDNGTFGFLLPDNQIEASGIETFEGIKALALYIKNTMSFVTTTTSIVTSTTTTITTTTTTTISTTTSDGTKFQVFKSIIVVITILSSFKYFLK